ncbi:putative lipid-transfer protein DIR1 [Argentina anserina]|uniref:putative lipid-transfer protein DIR1 n=1 Tax=Argentina anserina TaxID=57926 RepID=UPI00217646EB|nr:putative lipid-transfer protein DIR1 [Potentilla anserina]
MEATRKLLLAVAAMLVVVACINVEVSDAQTICNVSLNNLMSCQPAVRNPNPAKPTQACCSALKYADLGCLCSYKNSNLLPSLGIDPKLAMQLPAKCKLPGPAKC